MNKKMSMLILSFFQRGRNHGSFDQGIEMGRGGLFLQLTEEQYAKLTMR